MNAAHENKSSINGRNPETDLVEEEYLSDFFNDEANLLEEMDIYGHLVDDVANDEIWDIMQIEEIEDTAGWLIY